LSEARVETSGVVRARRPLVRWRRWVVWLSRLRGSPHAIAGGLAVGTLVTFTPLIGFQTLLALGLATLLGVNRPVSILPTWLTNPFTIPPVYAFTYWVGSFVWPGPSVAEVSAALRTATDQLARSDYFALREQLGALLELGRDVFGPMAIGGLAVGGVAAAFVYVVTLRTVMLVRERRAARRRERRAPPA